MSKKKHKALFLDRDGVINVDHGYVYKTEDFKFTEGIFDLVRLFKEKEYLIFIVTNQSGIGRGYYNENDFKLLTTWMVGQFKAKGIDISHVYYCPHTPEAQCQCRKPNTAMIEKALKVYPLDLDRSWMLGDKQSDIDFAQNVGIGYTVAIGRADITYSTYTFSSISKCLHYLEENKGKIL